MARLRFIVSLLLLAGFLLFFARSLEWVLALVKGTSAPGALTVPHPALEMPGGNTAALSQTWADQMTGWKQLLSEFAAKLTLPKGLSPADLPAPKTPPKATAATPKPEEPSLLHITMEDERPPLENPLVGPEISALLDDFLARRRAYNSQQVQAVQTLFGTPAAQEAVRILHTDETASFANAATCQTPRAFAANQQRIDDQTEQAMLALFNRYKREIGKQKDVSPEWKAFFKRVENYKRAAGQN